MMTSSNGKFFSVTGPLWGEFAGHRWIPPTKASDARALMLICAWTNSWANHRDANDLRHHRAHYDVTVMPKCCICWWSLKFCAGIIQKDSRNLAKSRGTWQVGIYVIIHCSVYRNLDPLQKCFSEVSDKDANCSATVRGESYNYGYICSKNLTGE